MTGVGVSRPGRAGVPFDRILRIGIDEAGYGPILGPLVVSGVSFEGAVSRASLWDVLEAAVTSRGAAGDDRVVIADSKIVHRGARGFERLERGVLAVMAVSGTPVASIADLVGRIAPGLGAENDQAPWYRGWSQPLPWDADPADVEGAAARLRVAMIDARVGVRDAVAVVVGEERFNARVASLGNKSAVAFESVAEVLGHLWADGKEGVAVVDRQGGRTRYAPLLQERFRSAWIWTTSEDASVSRYRIESDSAALAVSFEVGADAGHLEVALASMVSKYLRELFMRLFNAYWSERRPSLPRTSGYWEDGHRFLAALAPFLSSEGLSRSDLVRSR